MSTQAQAEAGEYQLVVIAGLVQAPKRLTEALGAEPRWFSLPEYQVLFRAIRSHHQASAARGKVRYATMQALERRVAETFAQKQPDKEKARRQRELQAAVNRALDEVASFTPVSEEEFRDALDQVRKHAMDERARVGLIQLVDRYRKAGSAGVYDAIRQLAQDISPSTDSTAHALLSEDVGQAVVDYETMKANPRALRVSTPFPRLDKVTGGGRMGRLWMCAAFSGDGKTQMAKDLIYHAAMVEGRGCVVITHEQTKKDVRNMIIVRHSHRFFPGGLPFNKVFNAELDEREYRAFRKTIEDLEKCKDYGPIRYWQAARGTTISDVRGQLEYFANKQPVDVAMLDHSMLFEPTVKQRSEQGDLSEVLKECKQISLDFGGGRGLWFIVCHQIKRDGYEAALKRGFYIPSDMAGSAEAERSADVMLWLLRDDHLKDMHEARIGVGKDRYSEGEPRGWEVMESFRSSALLPLEDGP